MEEDALNQPTAAGKMLPAHHIKIQWFPNPNILLSGWDDKW